MGDPKGKMPRGSVDGISIAKGVYALSVRGFVSFDVMAEVLARVMRALEDDTSLRAIVYDVSGIDGFEPGVPAKLIQWLGANSERLEAVVIVSTRPAIIALSRAAEVMVPSVRCVSAPTRAEAIAIATRLVGSRSRTQTGIRSRQSESQALRKDTG